MRFFTRLTLATFLLVLVGCSDVEPKPDTVSCGGDTTPDMCGCPGDMYPATECVDGQWFCPGPNGCPDGENNTTPFNNAVVNNATTGNNTIPNNPVCTAESVSDLPGVQLEITSEKCTFTRAELEEGVIFEFSYVIEDEIEISPAGEYSCWRSLPGNFPHAYQIAGDGQRYCLCDVGLCQQDTSPLTLQPGTYPQSFEWTGRNWDGPSDTGNPLGEPFPAGTYTLSVRSDGTYEGSQFDVVATLDITIIE